MEQCESLNEKLFPPSAEGPTNCPFPKKSEEPNFLRMSAVRPQGGRTALREEAKGPLLSHEGGPFA